MADSFIQLPADSTGKQLDTVTVNMGVGTTSVHREKIVLADPTSTSGFATVTSSAGLQTNLSSGLISVTSGTITSTSATNPWSSAPGFNVPVVSVSSGLVQVSAMAVSPTSSVAGAALLVVTSSFGMLVQSTQPVTVTSGLISVTSGTITSTAATNPWSSAPGFNVPVVSVSSGLVQVSGIPLVAVTTSVFSGVGLVTTGMAPVLVTSSGGYVFSFGVNTAAGYGPVTSSFGQLINQTTGSIPSVINATSANPTPVIFASSGAITPATAIASSVTKVSSSAGTLYSLQAFTTVPTGAILRLYNATTSNVSMGANVLSYLLTGAQSTVAGWEENLVYPGPRGFNFGTALSFDVVTNATSTSAVAGNTFVTWQFL